MSRKRITITDPKILTAVLPIVGRQTIEHAELLHESLRGLVQGDAQPVLDLSAVEECDVATLQLLYSAAATLAASSRLLTISALSPAMNEAIQTFGMQNEPLFCTSPCPAPHLAGAAHHSDHGELRA